MAEKEKHLGLILEGSQKLEELRQERQSLRSDIYTELEKTEELYGSLDAATMEKAKEEMAKIDQGLSKYGDFKQTIADLSEGLTMSLSEYVSFASESQNFQGMEKLFRLIPITRKKANRMRVERLRSQSPRENLKLILDYAEQLFLEIREVREEAIETFSRLQSNVDVITRKIAEYEPQESQLKDKLEAMEAAYKEAKSHYETADADQQAQMVERVNQMEKDLMQVRHEYDQIFTIYNQAQQALAANQSSRDAFEKMTRDLGRQATMIKEKIDNVTEVYMAAPEAVKVMMTTKGMETLDSSINVATDQSVDIITKSAEAVSDATLRREEIQLIDESVMRGYMQRMEQTMSDFNKRYDEIRSKAQRSQEARYGGEG